MTCKAKQGLISSRFRPSAESTHCTFLYLCVCVFVFACLCICICGLYLCVCVFLFVFLCVCIFVFVYLCICVFVYLYLCICVCFCVFVPSAESTHCTDYGTSLCQAASLGLSLQHVSPIYM